MQWLFFDVIIIIISSSTRAPDIRVHRAGSQLKMAFLQEPFAIRVCPFHSVSRRHLYLFNTHLDIFVVTPRHFGGDTVCHRPLPSVTWASTFLHTRHLRSRNFSPKLGLFGLIIMIPVAI